MAEPVTTTVAAGVAAAWLWDQYGKDFINKFGESAGSKWKKFNWTKAAQAYQNKIRTLYGTVRILGKNRPINLEGIFTDVYILDEPIALQRYDLEELKTKFAKNRFGQFQKDRKDGLSLIQQPESHRLFILGKPGAGKTTFLKYITLQAVTGKIAKTPIFVSLKEWSDSGLLLLPFMVKQFEICSFPDAQPFIEYLLKTGRAIVLFDGLDEVKQTNNQRGVVITEISNFSKQYDTVQCLVTCRIAATEYTFEHFTYVEMDDFNDEQIRIFVKKWFIDEKLIENFFAEFFGKENEGLRELGRIPLLLSLLCLAYEETLTFPQRRVEIYEEAVDALLKKWDTSRKIDRDELYHQLSLGRKRQMFARIAAETFEKGDYFLRQQDLEKLIVLYLRNLPPTDVDADIDGEAALKAVEAQHGIFVERAHRIYSFAHLTFQEYFTAKYIVDNSEKGTLNRLINKHLTDSRWREVFLLTASLLDDADTFFKLFRPAIDNLIKGDNSLTELLTWVRQQPAEAAPHLKPVLVRNLLIYLVLFRDLPSARDLGRDRTLTFDHASALERTSALDRALAYEPDLNLTHDLTHEFFYSLTFTHTRAHNLKINVEEIPEIDLSLASLNQFTKYLDVNRLFMDCLKLAYVSNRDELEDNLLLPPQV